MHENGLVLTRDTGRMFLNTNTGFYQVSSWLGFHDQYFYRMNLDIHGYVL
jgi:hypothetical protein